MDNVAIAVVVLLDAVLGWVQEARARSPRCRAARTIDVRIWVGIAGVGLVMALLTLLTIDLFLPGGLIEDHEDLTRARTAGITVPVPAQLFDCFNARSETCIAWHGLFANRWLWATVLLSVALQVAVVHLGLLNQAFGTRRCRWGRGACALRTPAGCCDSGSFGSGSFVPWPMVDGRSSHPEGLRSCAGSRVRQRTDDGCRGCQTAP